MKLPLAAAILSGLVAAASPSPLPAASLNCTLLPSTDCTGDPDIGHQSGATPSDCCTICSANPACGAFAHNAALSPPTCFFKSGCPTKAPAPSGTTAGVVSRLPPRSPCIGAISMTVEGGAKTTVHIMQSGGATGTVDLGGDSITLRHGGYRVYLTRTCDAAFTPSSFLKFSLLGKALSFSVDLRNGLGPPRRYEAVKRLVFFIQFSIERFCIALLYGWAGRLTAPNGDSWPGQCPAGATPRRI